MNNKGQSKTNNILFLSLFLFVALFAFSVGTYVGKMFTENDRRRMAYDQEYEELRASAGMNEETSDQISDADIDKLSEEFVKAEAQAMDEKEVKKPMAKAEVDEMQKAAKDGFVKMDRNVASKQPMKAKPAGKANQPTSVADKTTHKAATHKSMDKDMVKAAADRVVNNKAPLPTPTPQRELARVLPKISPNSVGKYTVQVASYATENEAKNHAKNLKDQGYSAFYLSAKVKSKVWYRVSVGLFDSRTTANNFKRELMKSANLKSAIIQKIIK